MSITAVFASAGFTFVGKVVPPEYVHIATSILVIFLIWQIGKRASAALRVDPDLPTDKLGIRALFEVIVEFLVNTTRTVIPHNPDRYLPLLGGLFIYILFSNLIGLVPGFEAPTSNINTNVAMSIVVFVAYNYYGIREHGIGYLKQFTGPLIWIAPLMFAIELVGHIFRPVTLGVRLSGNMIADHSVLGVFTGFWPHVGVPIIFYGLGTMICIIQAFVFYILTAVYIGLAVSHDH